MLYKYIKDLNKPRNILYYELKSIYLLLKHLIKINKYKKEIKNFFNEIYKDNYSSENFKKYLKYLDFYNEKII